VAKAVENAKAGQAQFRTDKAGIVHCAIGKASFEAEALKENLLSLVAALNKVKPAASKGAFLKKVTISTTMARASAWTRRDFKGLFTAKTRSTQRKAVFDQKIFALFAPLR